MKAANDNWPRGMRRPVAASYLGISPSHFDAQRRAGAIPAPRKMLGVELYDRNDLDALFGDTANHTSSNEADSTYWDRVCANENHAT